VKYLKQTIFGDNLCCSYCVVAVYGISNDISNVKSFVLSLSEVCLYYLIWTFSVVP